MQVVVEQQAALWEVCAEGQQETLQSNAISQGQMSVELSSCHAEIRRLALQVDQKPVEPPQPSVVDAAVGDATIESRTPASSLIKLLQRAWSNYFALKIQCSWHRKRVAWATRGWDESEAESIRLSQECSHLEGQLSLAVLEIQRARSANCNLLKLNQHERAARAGLAKEAQAAQARCVRLSTALAKEENMRAQALEHLGKVSAVSSLKERHLMTLLASATEPNSG